MSSSDTNYFGVTAYIYDGSITLDNNRTSSILKKLDLDWPEITMDYIQKIFNYIQKKNIFGGK